MDYLYTIGGVTVIWFLVVTIPGPNFVVTTHFSMAKSRNAGFCIALGVSTGAAVWAATSLLGLNALFELAPVLRSAIRVIGGLYLIYMGIKTLRTALRPLTVSDPHESLNLSGWRAFQRGLITSFSNPKTAAFFGGVFAAWFSQQPPLWVYTVTVLMVFSVSLFWYSLVVCFFSLSTVRQGYERVRRFVDLFTGSLISFLGVRLLLGQAER